MNAKTANFRNFRQARVRFETRDFTRSHVRAPRGRGSWAFCFDDDDAPWFAPSNSSYTDARKAAATEARSRGASVARVQP